MIHEHPLAYLLGLEGVASLRAFTGEHDRAFVEARIAEIRELLDDESLASAAVDVDRVDTASTATERGRGVRHRPVHGSVPPVRGPDGRPGRLVTHRHLVGDYLRAACRSACGCRAARSPPADRRPDPATGVHDRLPDVGTVGALAVVPDRTGAGRGQSRQRRGARRARLALPAARVA